jgi:hypothetical protein
MTVADLDAVVFPPQAAFDDHAVQSAVEAACMTSLAAFSDQHRGLGQIDMPVTRPSAQTWQQGDRRFQCFAGVAGHRIVSTQALPSTPVRR